MPRYILREERKTDWENIARQHDYFVGIINDKTYNRIVDGRPVNRATIEKLDEKLLPAARERYPDFGSYFFESRATHKASKREADSRRAQAGDQESTTREPEEVYESFLKQGIEYEKTRPSELFPYGYENKELTDDDPLRNMVLNRANTATNLWLEIVVSWKKKLSEEHYDTFLSWIIDVYDRSPICREFVATRRYLKPVRTEIEAYKQRHPEESHIQPVKINLVQPQERMKKALGDHFLQLEQELNETLAERPYLRAYGYGNKDLKENDPHFEEVAAHTERVLTIQKRVVRSKDDLLPKDFQTLMAKIVRVYENGPYVRRQIDTLPEWREILEAIQEFMAGK